MQLFLFFFYIWKAFMSYLIKNRRKFMNKTIYKRWMAHILPYNKGYPIANNNWVRWIHNATGIFHRFDCLKLHNCWFSENNHPDCPLHENCHCYLESIPIQPSFS